MKNVGASLTIKLSRIFGCIMEELSNHNFHLQFLMKTLYYLEAWVMKASLVSFCIEAEWTKQFLCLQNTQRLTKFCFAASTRIDMFVSRVLMNSAIDGRQSLNYYWFSSFCQHNKRWLLLVILIMSAKRRQVCRNNYCTTTFFDGRAFETCWLIKSDASLWNCRKFLMAIKSC